MKEIQIKNEKKIETKINVIEGKETFALIFIDGSWLILPLKKSRKLLEIVMKAKIVSVWIFAPKKAKDMSSTFS